MKRNDVHLWLTCLGVSFVFVVGSASPMANHCLTACGPFEAEPCSVSSHSEGVHALARAAERSDDDQGSDPADDGGACAGPTCLCHQHLAARSDLVGPAGEAGEFLALRAPELPDLGVIQKIGHVPRHTA